MTYAGNLIYSTVTALTGACPGIIKRLLRDISAAILYLISVNRRNNIKNNLLTVGKEAGRSTVFNIFRNHTANIIDMFELSATGGAVYPESITFHGREILERAVRNGPGAILITAHVGNWERAAFYLSSLGYKMYVVAGVQMNTLFTAPVKETKEKTGIRVINPGHSYRKLLRGLKSGGIAALLLDGDIYTGGIPVTFFGRKVIMPGGAVRLHRHSGAPVLAGYSRRRGNDSYDIVIREVLNKDMSMNMRDEEIINLLYGKMEGIILENYDQWCMFRNLWSREI